MARESPLKDKVALEAAIAKSQTSKEVLEHLGLRAAGGNYLTLRKYATQFGLLLPENDYAEGTRPTWRRTKLPDEAVFIEDSSYADRSQLKKRLYAMGVKEECVECGSAPVWNGKPLSLHLDHINGIHNDNRLENLRILCPNCHSQTETYAGRTTTEHKIQKSREAALRRAAEAGFTGLREDCDTPTYGIAKRCRICAPKARYGTKYPEMETLIVEVRDLGFVQTAKKLGVSDNALRKHMKKELGTDHPVFFKKKRV